MSRSVEEYLKDPDVTEAEEALIKACQLGVDCKINNGTLPAEDDTDPAHTIRAELIRLLAMGGTADCGLHEAGVWLEGARITGFLDLRFARCRGSMTLKNCRFEEEPQLNQAELAELSFDGSHLPGLSAQGMRVTGSVFLRRVTAKGTVVVNRAQIGGQLTCRDAKLDGAGERALNAQGVEVAQSLSLDTVTAKGTVEVNRAQIGGQLSCKDAELDGAGNTALNAQGLTVAHRLLLRNVNAIGTVDMTGAQIGGQLSCVRARLDGGGKRALNAQRATVEGAILFQKVLSIAGQVDLTSASAGDLLDDAASWEKCDKIALDGFRYDRLPGSNSPKTFATRKSWLKKGSQFGDEFFPQPYTQFAKVMRAAGHAAEGRKTLMERDTILFEVAEKADREALNSAYNGDDTKGDCGVIWLRLHGRRIWASLSRRIIGHGYAPQRALYWTLGLWAGGVLAYFFAYRLGLMVPNSAVIMTSAEWLAAVEQNRDAPTLLWMGDGVGASAHYETFFAGIYALDVLLPLVDFGQEQAWAVTTTTTPGWILRALTFGYQIAGWVVTSLGLAAITGFVQRNAPD